MFNIEIYGQYILGIAFSKGDTFPSPPVPQASMYMARSAHPSYQNPAECSGLSVSLFHKDLGPFPTLHRKKSRRAVPEPVPIVFDLPLLYLARGYFVKTSTVPSTSLFFSFPTFSFMVNSRLNESNEKRKKR